MVNTTLASKRKMAKIFITGSADGLGQLAAKALIAQGHQVVLHARNETRGQQAMNQAGGAEGVVTADLANVDDTKELAVKVNALGTFDAVIHNAGVYQDTAPQVFAVNTLAPYILTCLIHRPERLIYLSSGMHMQGHFRAESFKRPSYSDSKLHVLMLAKAVARRWTNVYSNAVDPGWVPTKMGGKGAPDDLKKGYETQIWLATSNDAQARVSGNYFHHQKVTHHNPEADDVRLQARLVSLCEEITGVSFP
jgi:NAD(P)-dependent dehydrogenase (short-subunit alcohol dehydrogenase family)